MYPFCQMRLFLKETPLKNTGPSESNLFANVTKCMRGSRRFRQRGSNYDIFFLVDERIKIPQYYKRANIGPPAKRHLNGVSLACR